jgi:hypothetical protein
MTYRPCIVKTNDEGETYCAFTRNPDAIILERSNGFRDLLPIYTLQEFREQVSVWNTDEHEYYKIGIDTLRMLLLSAAREKMWNEVREYEWMLLRYVVQFEYSMLWLDSSQSEELRIINKNIQELHSINNNM